MPSSFFMPSLDMVSFDIVSFFMPSFDMESLDIESLDMLSFFMPSSLPILSWAKATGASARLSESAAAEIPSAVRVRMVMMGHPFENRFLEATDAALILDAPTAPIVTVDIRKNSRDRRRCLPFGVLREEV